MTRIGAVSVLAALLAASGLVAQEPKPRFEVASVKRQPAFVPPTPPSGQPPSRMAFRRYNATLLSLVRFAYDLLDTQVAGGPEWIREDLFEINAKAAADVSTEQMRLMVQALLEERFALVAHTEQREMRSYTLALARSDGRLGTNLRRCEDPNNPPPSKPVRLPTGGRPFGGRCEPISTVALAASGMMSAPVADKTGLTGLWSYSFIYAPREAIPSDRELELAKQENLLPFAAALQEELGLKLESTRGPVAVLVIDSVQQPTEN
jgi:uncharacterized protein (TIGR03435 family)